MANLPGIHQRDQRFERIGEVFHRSAELHHRQAGIRQMRHKLRRLIRVIGALPHLKTLGLLKDMFLNGVVIDHPAGGERDPAFGSPPPVDVRILGGFKRVFGQEKIGKQRIRPAVFREEVHNGVQIALAGEVKAHETGLPGEASPRQAGLGALLPVRHVERGGAGVAPDIQVLGLERILLRGVLDGLQLLRQQVVFHDRNTEIRVRLPQRLGALPIVIGVDGVDDGKQFLILKRAIENLPGAEPHVIAGAAKVEARRGDDDDQRLAACAHAGDHGIVQARAVVLVVFVNDGAVRRRAVAGVPDQRLESGRGTDEVHILGADVHAVVLHEAFGALGHDLRGAVHFPRLFFRSGAGVHFRPRFPILHEHIEADRGHKAGLPVLARDFHIGFPESPQPVLGALPAEQR